ncbi:MAG: diheme cytochrome c-553 [candidate division KSB1 bacterium]|nr:diheme cytochrome c-553 [candidate division KSB1 bacterium]MDZ7304784.1 diheme cytochrome c-553 [candidate division KSB1 bacterium]MDZ7313870.1 diheme cytochrome c-553 [candidate division KSB1 bacterium]
MQKLIILSMGVLLVVLLGCEKKMDPVARGKYLVTIGGCHDCHTPTLPGPGGMPVPDTTRLLSGHPEDVPYPVWMPVDIQQRNTLAMAGPMLTAWAGPWGVSFAANLTPDNGTGLGAWTEAEFIQAVRTGKHHGHPNGREILPPMPWQNLRDATDEDLEAMWTYLRSIPAIKNRVPFPVPPTASGGASH